MGIKFFCPNGHKLNVKSFLSGKKAICPQCGAKVTVPAQSQPAPGNAEADDQPTPENGTDVSPAAADQVHAAADAAVAIAEHFASKSPGAAAIGISAAVESPQPVRPAGNSPAPIGSVATGNNSAGHSPTSGANPAGFAQSAAPVSPTFAGWPNSSAAAPGGFGARSPAAAPMFPTAALVQPAAPVQPVAPIQSTAPAAPMAGFGSVGVRDAIDEAPAAVWYVRPASGGQFGPAPGETMRAWIDEGRVAATALVWRAGWPEWRSAAATFPKLAATVAAPWSPAPGYGAAPAAPVMPVQSSPWGATAAPMGMAPVAPAGMTMAPVQSVGIASPAGFPVGQVVGGLDVVTESFVTSDQSDESGGRVRKRRRQQADMTMIVSIILVVLTIVLVIVLAVVLNRQNEPGPAAPELYHGPKATESAKEKPAAKEPAKKPTSTKKTPAKKAPEKKAKPADTMDENEGFE